MHRLNTSANNLKAKPAFKLWFEINGKYVFGEGTCNLLEKVNELGSINAAAKSIGMSYRYAWGLIRKVEESLGKSAVKTQKGGKLGGKTELTETGRSLVASYRHLKRIMTDACRLE